MKINFEGVREGVGTFPVPGKDRKVRIAWETIYRIEELFYNPRREGRKLSDFGNFEPAFFIQGPFGVKKRAFSINAGDGSFTTHRGVSPQFSKDKEERLDPENVIFLNTRPDKLPDILSAAMHAIHKETKGISDYRWDWQFVIERQTAHKVYEDLKMPGPGWVCIRRAKESALEEALHHGRMPSAAGMAPWVVVSTPAFPVTPFREALVAPSVQRGKKKLILSNLKVGAGVALPFPNRRSAHSTLQRARELTPNSRFRIEDDCTQPGFYVITRDA